MSGRRPTIPVACTLPADELPGRIEDWRALVASARSCTWLPDGAVRIELADDVDVGEVARLAHAEQTCCAFLDFDLTIDGRGAGLEVRAPAEAREVLAALVGLG